MSLLREAERCLANQKAYAGLNAFITPLQHAASWLDRVQDAEARKVNGSSKSSLDGRLVAIKDNICTRAFPTTCASEILDKFNSPFDATVVKALEGAGAVIAGKTNLDEFGMGSHSTYSRFGPVKNASRAGEAPISAGGSSGGSAVAVATGQCYAALGTDTGGSVRLPAAYTGTVGFKPSYGLISRWGVIAYANSLDTVGIIGRKTSVVRNIFSMLYSQGNGRNMHTTCSVTQNSCIDLLNYYDPRDPTNLTPPSRSRISACLATARFADRRQLRIGVPLRDNLEELTPTARRAWVSALTHLEKQGHILQPVTLQAIKQALPAYYVLAPAEAFSNLAKYDGVRYGTRTEGPDNENGQNGYLYAKTRGEGFGAEVKRRILLGSFSLSADAIDNYFIQAQRVRRLIQADFNNAFSMPNPLVTSALDDISPAVDVLVGPTAPSTPPSLASLIETSDASSSLYSYVTDVFTVPASLAGLPAISVPVTVPKPGSPPNGISPFRIEQDSGNESSDLDTIGIQIIGQYGDDEIVLRVGEMLEHTNFTT